MGRGGLAVVGMHGVVGVWGGGGMGPKIMEVWVVYGDGGLVGGVYLVDGVQGWLGLRSAGLGMVVSRGGSSGLLVDTSDIVLEVI